MRRLRKGPHLQPSERAQLKSSYIQLTNSKTVLCFIRDYVSIIRLQKQVQGASYAEKKEDRGINPGNQSVSLNPTRNLHSWYYLPTSWCSGKKQYIAMKLVGQSRSLLCSSITHLALLSSIMIILGNDWDENEFSSSIVIFEAFSLLLVNSNTRKPIQWISN